MISKICKKLIPSILGGLILIAPITASHALDDKLPLDAFAMKPLIQSATVSPDGKRFLMVRATNRAGFYVLEVYDAKDPSKKDTHGSTNMTIASAGWLNNRKILITQYREVNEGARTDLQFQTGIIDVITKKYKQIRDDGRAGLLSSLPKDKNHILVTYDADRNRYPDVVKVNVNTLRKSVIFRGSDKHAGGYFIDVNGQVRTSNTYNLGNDTITLNARTQAGKWKKVHTISPKVRESFGIVGIDGDNPDLFYISANLGENTTGIYSLNIETMEYSERLFGLKSVDAGGVMLSSKPETMGRLNGFTYNTSKFKRHWIDPNEEALYKSIEALFPKKTIGMNRSYDDNTIIISVFGERDAGSYYLLRDKKDLTFLAKNFPLQDEKKLGDVKYYKYKARDGRTIRSFVTKPNGKGPFPTVVMPHGGPWVRDGGGYDTWAQFLANQGYLVIQPQYRGSTGFGLDHWVAGDNEWGLKMQDDLDDAALHAVEKGWADKDRLAMFGWSYGGYAAFVASMRENNLYKCSIAGAGVSDIDKIKASTFSNRFLRIYQRSSFGGVSPADNVDKVNIPLLIIHGDIDYVVPVSHSRVMIPKLKKYNKDYKYVEMKGLSHHSFRFTYEHSKTFYTEIENWLNNKCFNK